MPYIFPYTELTTYTAYTTYTTFSTWKLFTVPGETPTQTLKLKEKYVSRAEIYNEWFGIGTSTRIIPGEIYSLDTLHPEWHRNNNSAFKKKFSCLQFIFTTVATLNSSPWNTDALVLYALEEATPPKNALFLESRNLSNRSKKYEIWMALFSTKLIRNIWLLMKLGCQMMFFMCYWGIIIICFHW